VGPREGDRAGSRLVSMPAPAGRHRHRGHTLGGPRFVTLIRRLAGAGAIVNFCACVMALASDDPVVMGVCFTAAAFCTSAWLWLSEEGCAT
jgi:hypothetical protein